MGMTDRENRLPMPWKTHRVTRRSRLHPSPSDQHDKLTRSFQQSARQHNGSDEQLRQVHKAIERHKIQAVVLMDFVHILNYLWDAARYLYKLCCLC